jgi:hypothetical protein
MRNILKTAMVVGISRASAESYWDLHRDLIEKDAFYRARIDEVLEVGQEHWFAVDGKKSRSRMPECPRGKEDRP